MPAENLLGEEGQGFVNFMRTLDAGRIGIAALSLGLAEGAFEQALRYATRAASSSASRSSSFQGVQFQLSDMATEIEAGQAPDVPRRVARAARQAVHEGSGDGEAVLLRARHARDASRRSRSTAATATRKDYPVERMMRDAKICEIGEGTSEIQRLVIARQPPAGDGGLTLRAGRETSAAAARLRAGGAVSRLRPAADAADAGASGVRDGVRRAR